MAEVDWTNPDLEEKQRALGVLLGGMIAQISSNEGSITLHVVRPKSGREFLLTFVSDGKQLVPFVLEDTE